jgi:hypothetical protein
MPKRPARARPNRGEAGSASLELIGTLPFLLVAILVAAQLAIAGGTLWSAAVGARAKARQALISGRGGGGYAERELPRLVPGLPRVSATVRTSLGPR